MAEAIGLAAAIIQIVQLGFKCSQTLYNFSHSVSNHSSSIERLKAHVETNSQVLKNLAALLEDDEKLNANLRSDIERAAKDCRRVFEQIVTIFDSVTTSKSSFHRVFNKAKYAAVLENQVKGFRQELQEHQVTLNLVLLIHWQSDVSGTRNAVVELLKNGLAHASNSKVPVVADAVKDIITSLGISEATPPGESSLSLSDTASMKPSTASSTTSTLAPVTSLFSIPSHALPSSASSITTSKSLKPAESQPQPPVFAATNAPPPSVSVRTMWDARPGKDKKLTFEERAIPRTVIDDFVRERASKLLDALAGLDSTIAHDLQSHAASLKEVLLAIHVYRKESTFGRRKISSINFVTEDHRASGGTDILRATASTRKRRPSTPKTANEAMARFEQMARPQWTASRPAAMLESDDDSDDDYGLRRRIRRYSDTDMAEVNDPARMGPLHSQMNVRYSQIEDKEELRIDRSGAMVTSKKLREGSKPHARSEEQQSVPKGASRTTVPFVKDENAAAMPAQAPIPEDDPHKPAQAPPSHINDTEYRAPERLAATSVRVEPDDASLLPRQSVLTARETRKTGDHPIPQAGRDSTTPAKASGKKKAKPHVGNDPSNLSWTDGRQEQLQSSNDAVSMVEPKLGGKSTQYVQSDVLFAGGFDYMTEVDGTDLPHSSELPHSHELDDRYTSSAGPTPGEQLDDTYTSSAGPSPENQPDDTYTSSAGPVPETKPDDSTTRREDLLADLQTFSKTYLPELGQDNPEYLGLLAGSSIRDDKPERQSPARKSGHKAPTRPSASDSLFASRPENPADTFAARQALDAARQARQAQQGPPMPDPPPMPDDIAYSPAAYPQPPLQGQPAAASLRTEPAAAVMPARLPARMGRGAFGEPVWLGGSAGIDDAAVLEGGVGLSDDDDDDSVCGRPVASPSVDDEGTVYMCRMKTSEEGAAMAPAPGDDSSDISPAEEEEQAEDANLAAIAEQLMARLGARWNAEG